MISKILVPTDFSDNSRKSLSYALAMAKKCNASVALLHINHVAMIDASISQVSYMAFLEEEQKIAQESFEKLENEVLINSRVAYSYDSITGFVGDEVTSYAESHEVDLIVLSTRSTSAIDELLIGSNSASIVSKTNVPVIVIPPDYTGEGNIRNIVYASDYSEPEFPQVSKLLYLADLYEANLQVVHVTHDNDRYFDSENNFFSRNKDKISYPKISFARLDKGDVIESINKFCADYKTDLLVLAKHHRSFFDRLFHRSLSKQMIYHTHVPLLVMVK